MEIQVELEVETAQARLGLDEELHATVPIHRDTVGRMDAAHIPKANARDAAEATAEGRDGGRSLNCAQRVRMLRR